jgi:hypothetical protein
MQQMRERTSFMWFFTPAKTGRGRLTSGDTKNAKQKENDLLKNKVKI